MASGMQNIAQSARISPSCTEVCCKARANEIELQFVGEQPSFELLSVAHRSRYSSVRKEMTRKTKRRTGSRKLTLDFRQQAFADF